MFIVSSTAGPSPFVLNCTNQQRSTYEQDIKELFDITIKDVPFEATVWTPNTILTNNFVQFYILTILLHILPAILIDLVLKFSRRQPM